MNLRTTLTRLVKVVLEEADRNSAFEMALSEALSPGLAKRGATKGVSGQAAVASSDAKRAKNRRAQAVLDPVQRARDGEPALRAALVNLNLEQLRDIVAEYGMDPGRSVIKWVDQDRVMDRVVEMSLARAHKGSAFRKPIDEVVASASSDGPAIPEEAPPAQGQASEGSSE